MKIRDFFDQHLQQHDATEVPELTLHYRRSHLARERLADTEAQVKFLRKLFDPGTFELQEEILLLVLDGNNWPVTYYKLAKGDFGSVTFPPNMVFQILLTVGANRFILAHNHPEHNPLASFSDYEGSHAMNLRAKWFDIEMIDDIVISRLEEPETDEDGKGYFSMRENDLMFE